MDDAWAECSELQFTSLQEFKRRANASVCPLHRLELVATVNRRAAGLMILVVDEEDLHVGRCLTVQWQYVLPEFRNVGIASTFMREVRRVARELHLPTIAFTHRLGPGVYKTSYRRVYGKEN